MTFQTVCSMEEKLKMENTQENTEHNFEDEVGLEVESNWFGLELPAKEDFDRALGSWDTDFSLDWDI